jgi:uncharacterized membrane protein
MLSELLIALLAGLGGMLGWGLADFFAKKAVDRLDSMTILFWSQLIGIFPLLIMLPTHPIPTVASIAWLQILLLGIVDAVSYLLLYRGFSKGQISILSPVFAAYSIVVVLVSALIFGEMISPLAGFSLVLLCGGIVLVSDGLHDFKHSLLRSGKISVHGLPEVAAAMVLYGAWLAFFDAAIGTQDWVFFALAIRVVATVSVLVCMRATHRVSALPARQLWGLIVCIGLLDVFGYSAVAFGFISKPHTNIVAGLSAAF